MQLAEMLQNIQDTSLSNAVLPSTDKQALTGMQSSDRHAIL